MKNDLDHPLKASSFKQVKRPNGKYGHLSFQCAIGKCDICGKNVQRKKLFYHFKEYHQQYFCLVCRARFKMHNDLISHIKDIHQLVASENLNKFQDTFSDSIHKRYFAEPLLKSQIPVSTSKNLQFSNSSSEDDELLSDNLDVLDIILGTKSCDQRSEEIEIGNIINDLVNSVISDINAEQLFESTLQDLSYSDLSVTDESDIKVGNKLDISECGDIIHSSPQTHTNDILLNSINNISEINISCKSPNDKDSSQKLHNVEEEFKLEIHNNLPDVLSEKSPWVNGPETSQIIDNSSKNDSDLITMALTLDHKLTDMNMNIILKECIRTSCLTCVYCHNATCIAVNGKQLALHMIEKHRFMTVKNESSEDVVSALKSYLDSLENVYLNSENFDSTDELSHIPFNNTFYCFNCQFTSKQMKEVNSHKRSFHSRKTYDCIMCKITFANYGELHCHLCPGADFGTWQNLSFRCLFCGQGKIPSAFRCMVHLRKAHNACDYCLETFPNQQSLALHVNKHKMRHMCLKCNITYLSKKDIFEHMFWKHNRDSKECKLCLTKKWPYTYHFCVPPAIFSCDECKRTYSSALLLKVHERWHSGNIPYECNTCHCKFISKKLLKKHEIIHKEVLSPLKKRKKKKKKKGDDYNLPPLNLSSDSDTEKTPRYKMETCLKSPSPSSNNYWDYVSKQKKELVNNALIDHDYISLSTLPTSLPSQSDVVKSPQYLDELSPTVNGNENILNNSFDKSCHRSSCSSHCNSSSSSSSCGSNCSCSASCSSSDSEMEEKKKPVVESPKKHKRKKKEKKIKVLSAKKVANFNLGALESDLESEFVDTDDEDYYDINPVPLHPEVNSQIKDNLQLKQKSLDDNKLLPSEKNSPLIPRLFISNDHNYKLCLPKTKPNQFSNIESQILEKNEVLGLPQNDFKISDQCDGARDNNSYTPIQHLSSVNENSLPANNHKESIENNFTNNSLGVYNGEIDLPSVKNESNLSACYDKTVDSFFTPPNMKIYLKSSLLKKQKNRKSRVKKSSPLPKTTLSSSKESYIPSPLSVNSLHFSTQSKNVTLSNDTRQSKRQPKKRKFFGYDSDEERQIPNGESAVFQQNSPCLQPPKKKKQKRKSKQELPLQSLHYSTTQLTQSQQSRPIVDVRISKIVVPPVADDTDSDSGNLVIELPKCVEQKAVQSTERLYCHCRCPYDEVSEMIACDNPNCRVEWFHFDCVGIVVAPKGNWYCPDCR